MRVRCVVRVWKIREEKLFRLFFLGLAASSERGGPWARGGAGSERQVRRVQVRLSFVMLAASEELLGARLIWRLVLMVAMS